MQHPQENEEEPPPDKSLKVKYHKKNVSVSNKTLLRDELKKEYYNEDFLDRFDLPEKMDISAVIPTYNRCPYDPKKPEGKFNPLYWCLESLINQRPRLNEIVIINDNSNDYTRQVVQRMRKKAKTRGINFVFLINKKKKGSSISRNIGVKRATSNLVLFLDDDCIAKKYSSFGVYYTFKKLSEEGIKVGAVHLPVYMRITCPSFIIKMDKIGVLNIEKGEVMTSNFERFPKKYLNDGDKFLDGEYKILKPIQIQKLCGCFLTPKKRFLGVGGFPDFFTWENSADEETELACRFMANGYVLFFCPDPKFGLYHGRFGDSSKIPLNKRDFKKYRNDKLINDIPLYKINEECAKPRLNTGNRVSIEDWYYSQIISPFVIFYLRNLRGALNWVEYTKKVFVEEHYTKKFGGGGKARPLEDHDKRERIWYTAILDGLELVTKKDKDEMWNFLKELEEIRKFNLINKLKIFGSDVLKEILP